MQNRELRLHTTDLEVRATANGKAVIRAYAAVFRRLSQDLGGFVEEVVEGAFTKTLQEADVRALVNHDPNRLLGRNRSGTLRLAEDSTGLHYEVDVPNTQDARDVQELAERGDLTGSSFGFRAIEQDWGLTEQEYPKRSLLQVHLYDVGPVTYPAYLSTDEEGARVALRSLASHLNVPDQKITEALETRSLGALLKDPQAAEEREAPDEQSTPAEHSGPSVADLRALTDAVAGAEPGAA